MRAMSIRDLGAQLREARRRAGLSQLELAEPLGMSRATISAIESGRCREIGASKLIALLEMTGLELVVKERRSRPTIDELRAELRSDRRE
jgi:transcriptional regulator with XRE-family HTH domain